MNLKICKIIVHCGEGRMLEMSFNTIPDTILDGTKKKCELCFL